MLHTIWYPELLREDLVVLGKTEKAQTAAPKAIRYAPLMLDAEAGFDLVGGSRRAVKEFPPESPASKCYGTFHRISCQQALDDGIAPDCETLISFSFNDTVRSHNYCRMHKT